MKDEFNTADKLRLQFTLHLSSLILSPSDPWGNRTPAYRLRTCCPMPLDERAVYISTDITYKRLVRELNPCRQVDNLTS